MFMEVVLTDYINLVEKLDADLEELGKFLFENRGNSALESAYIRTFFSTVEGFLFAFRQEVLARENFEELFDLAEQAKLKEVKFDRIRQTLTKKPQFLGFKETLKFSCKSIAKARGVNPKSLGFQGVEWDNFLAANKIRDQITHPKTLDDLQIGNDKLEIVIRAKVWLKNEVLQQLVK
ncbi:hypothetical protein AYI87_02130 [Shewanella sp. KCT]|nr:hypothetical protein AYI87_02130 [Shewanella sp. KCT]